MSKYQTIISSVMVSIAVMLSLSGCFKPDLSTDTTENSRLTGYWECVHLKERDITYEISDDGSKVNPMDNSTETDVTLNDGSGDYKIIRFTENFVTLIATDDPDMASILNLPYTYTFDGKTISGLFFAGDFNPGNMEIEFIGNDTMIISGDDSGYDEDGDSYDDYYSWTTFKRIN